MAGTDPRGLRTGCPPESRATAAIWTLDILEGISWQAVHEWSRTVPPSSEVYRVLSGESQLH
jgi:hypothetical protein